MVFISSSSENKVMRILRQINSRPLERLALARFVCCGFQKSYSRRGLKKTKLYALQKKGAFPMRIQITANSVGWIEEEVNVWIAGRVAASKPLRTNRTTQRVTCRQRAGWKPASFEDGLRSKVGPR
jgi:predicted DNA-binding transcriptional regulator AlpA